MMIDVKVINSRGQSALVEYIENGRLKRKTVPVKDVIDNQVNKYNLNLGISYGIEWSKLVKLNATPEQLEQNLRNAGIWTKEDALNNAQIVQGVLQKTYGIDYAAILRIAKEAK